MSTSNKNAWYLGDDAVDLEFLYSVVGEQNIIPMASLGEAPSKLPVLLVIDVDGVADWERQLSEVEIGDAKVALVSNSPMSQVFIRSMYGDTPRRWYLGRLVSGTLPDSFVRALGACLHGENEVLKLELSDLKGKVSTLEEVRDSKAATELDLRRQLGELADENSELLLAKGSLSVEKDAAGKRLAQIEEELLASERSLLDSREAGDHSRKLVVDVQDELNSLRTQSSTLQQSVEDKDRENLELNQLLDDNRAAVDRLRDLNGDLTNKLDTSSSEVTLLQDKLQEESDKVAVATEAEAASKLAMNEANERVVIAGRELEVAESQRDTSSDLAAEAAAGQELAQALADKSEAEALDANREAQAARKEAAGAFKAAETAREEAVDAVGKAEARTLEAYGLLSDRTEALEDECLLAANLGEERNALNARLDDQSAQLEEREAELQEASSLGAELASKLEVAVEQAQSAEKKASFAEKSASDSSADAESAREAAAVATEAATKSAVEASESREAELVATEAATKSAAEASESREAAAVSSEAATKFAAEAVESREAAAVATETATRSVAEAAESRETAAVATEAATKSAAEAAESQEVAAVATQAASKATEEASESREAEAVALRKMNESLALVDQSQVARRALEEDLERQKAEIASTSLECDQLSDQGKAVRAELSAAVTAHNTTLLEREATHQQKIEDLCTDRDLALSQAQQELEESLSNANRASAEKLAANQSTHESDLVDVKDSHDKFCQEQQEGFLAQVANRREEHETLVTGLATKHSEAISELTLAGEAKVATVIEANDRSIALLREEMESLATLAAQAEAKRFEAEESRELAAAEAASKSLLAESATKERDEAIESSERSTEIASAAEMKASEAQKEMNDARASAEQAHLELEAVRANSDRRQVELQEQLVEAQQRNSEQSANVEQLKVEVLSKAEMLESAVGERDRLSIELSERSSELEQQSTQALEREKEFEALRYENREISTKLVALESMQAQHLAELEDLRRALDDSELTSKEVSARAETALSALAEMGSSLESQANDYEGKIERLGEGLASERASGIQATEHLESQLAEAIIKVGQLEAANTDAVMEIATLRASQSHAPTIVHPPAQSVDEATPQVAIAPVDDDAAVSALSGFDERARRLEGELAEAKNRLRATSSGVVWSARREPEVKEGLLGRLKGSIRRSGDH